MVGNKEDAISKAKTELATYAISRAIGKPLANQIKPTKYTKDVNKLQEYTRQIIDLNIDVTKKAVEYKSKD